MTRISLFPLLFVLAGGLSTLAGCDRQSGPGAQPQETGGTGSATQKAAQADGGSGAPAAKGGDLTGKIDRTHKGEAIPTYTFSDPAGNRLRPADFKDKQPVLINLWATWCAPCVREMPMLDKLAGDLSGKLRVVTVSQDMKGAAIVTPFFKQKGFKHLEPWLDKNNDLAFYYSEAAVLPMTILYDKSGHEIWRISGGFDWTSPEAKKMVAEAVK